MRARFLLDAVVCLLDAAARSVVAPRAVARQSGRVRTASSGLR